MEQPKRHIDEALKDRFGTQEETPPVEIWGSLSLRLQNKSKGNNRFPGRSWMVLLIAAILFIGIHWFFTKERKNENSTTRSAVGYKAGTANNVQESMAADTAKATISTNDTALVPSDDTANQDQIDKKTVRTQAQNERTYRKTIGNSTLNKQSGYNTSSTYKGRYTKENVLNKIQRRNKGKELSIESASTQEFLEKETKENTPGTSNEKQINPNNYQVMEAHAIGDTNRFNPEMEPLNTKKGISTLSRDTVGTFINTTALQDTQTGKNTFLDTANKEQQQNNSPGINRKLALGIKTGYERVFDAGKSDLFLIGPFLQYELNKKIAVSIQPSVKYGRSNISPDISQTKEYYRVSNSAFDSSSIFSQGAPGGPYPDTVYRTYAYSQTYDSIIISHTINKRKLWELEIPVLLSYHLTKNISLLGGVSMNYSSILQVTENRKEYNGLYISDTVNFVPELYYQGSPIPSSPEVESFETKFPHYITPYGQYNRYNNAPSRMMRFGYMIGITYQLKNRISFDVMLKQSILSKNKITNDAIHDVYFKPSIRFTVGYKFIKI